LSFINKKNFRLEADEEMRFADSMCEMLKKNYRKNNKLRREDRITSMQKSFIAMNLQELKDNYR